MGFNSAFKGLKLLKNPGNGRLNYLNDPVLNVLNNTVLYNGVGSGSALPAGRSRVRFPMVSQEFFVDIILPAELMPLIDSSYKINEYQEYFVGRLRRSARRADNLTTSMRRLS